MPNVEVPRDFLEATQALGVSLSPEQVARLAEFVGLLLAANERFNLTSIREPGEAWSRHVLDSLSLVPALALEAGGRVIDVGAGGGLPGLVLAIARPDLSFTLVDATGKKVRHLQNCAEQLGLGNVQAIQGRAEDLAGTHGGEPSVHREAYDLAVARALAPMPVLLELVIPFLRPRGRFLAIKGERALAEVDEAKRAMAALHVTLESQQRTDTGTILCLRKHAATPKRYPRRSGEPKRSPL